MNVDILFTIIIPHLFPFFNVLFFPVLPDRIEPLELVSGQNDSLSFNVHSKLVLLCTGSVGDPPTNIHWCIKRSTEVFSKLYDIQEDISNGIPYLFGCQYIQTSNITYVVSNKDSHTLLRCYAGDSDQCNNNFIPYEEFLVRKGMIFMFLKTIRKIHRGHSKLISRTKHIEETKKSTTRTTKNNN